MGRVFRGLAVFMIVAVVLASVKMTVDLFPTPRESPTYGSCLARVRQELGTVLPRGLSGLDRSMCELAGQVARDSTPAVDDSPIGYFMNLRQQLIALVWRALNLTGL